MQIIKLSLGLLLKFFFDIYPMPNGTMVVQDMPVKVIFSVLTLSVPPTFRVKSPDGDWLAGPAVASYARGSDSVKVYEDALNYDNNTDKFNLSQYFTFNIMKGLTFKTTGTWFYFDDSREFFKGDYIVATGPVYDTNHSTSNKHERLLDQTYNGILIIRLHSGKIILWMRW